MKKFYEKSEIWFAVTWIIIYVVVMGNICIKRLRRTM